MTGTKPDLEIFSSFVMRDTSWPCCFERLIVVPTIIASWISRLTGAKVATKMSRGWITTFSLVSVFDNTSSKEIEMRFR